MGTGVSSLAGGLVTLLLWAAVVCMAGPRMVGAVHRALSQAGKELEAKRIFANHEADVFDATATFRARDGKSMTLRLELGERTRQRSSDEAE